MPTSYSIILVSPKGSLNVGSVARAMANFGISDLRIVAPRCPLDSHECKQMAMTAITLVQNAKIFATLQEAHADLQYTIALSGRTVEDNRPAGDLFEFCEKKLPELDRGLEGQTIGLVFGREDTGLRLEEIDECDIQMWISTVPETPSMNLGAAVAVVLSHIHRALGSRIPNAYSLQVIVRPPKRQQDVFFERIEVLLEKIKFANPQNPVHTVDDLKRLYHRADLEDRDLRILFGVLNNIEITLGYKHTRSCPQ